MKPWHTWLLFVLCLVVLLSAMGWISSNVLRLERANVQAQQKAAVEETIRLALWRMDAAISPLIVEESARPYFDYNAFNWASVVNPNRLSGGQADELIPSPLLLQTSSNVNLYFNGVADARGRWAITSPQVPAGDLLMLAKDNYRLEDAFAARNERYKKFLGNVSGYDLQSAVGVTTNTAGIQVALADYDPQRIVQAASANQSPANQGQGSQSVQAQQEALNTMEYARRVGQARKTRSKVLSSKQQQWYSTQKKQPGLYFEDVVDKAERAEPSADMRSSLQQVARAAELELEERRQAGGMSRAIDESMMRPFWIKGFLVLARTVTVGKQRNLQGAWLNWGNLKRELLNEVADILPAADLVPVKPGVEVAHSRMMAALPVMLVPGTPARLPRVIGSPLAIPLTVAWVCVLLAAASVGLLLVGAISLSERRGAFVSAVTHELRTPLTTFRMYSEMLAEDMVADETKRKRYLETLCAEGNRLSHLVENVLSFARLERGRAGSHVEDVSLHDMVDRVRDRLTQRVEQAEMELLVEPVAGADSLRLKVDLSAIEQILFNLVDNACKYAGRADDKRVHIESSQRNGQICIRVRDHGPGIAEGEARMLFKPFRKSAKHAAESAPGVGLGLALSRRLARQMGGQLRIDPSVRDGACFELILPV